MIQCLFFFKVEIVANLLILYICCSSDTYNAQAQKKQPVVSSLRTQQRIFPEADKFDVSPNEGTVDVNHADVFGTGLQNEVGEYNCFLNVIIQVLSYFSNLWFLSYDFIASLLAPSLASILFFLYPLLEFSPCGI